VTILVGLDVVFLPVAEDDLKRLLEPLLAGRFVNVPAKTVMG
jgi:hypothetical protein